MIFTISWRILQRLISFLYCFICLSQEFYKWREIHVRIAWNTRDFHCFLANQYFRPTRKNVISQDFKLKFFIDNTAERREFDGISTWNTRNFPYFLKLELLLPPLVTLLWILLATFDRKLWMTFPPSVTPINQNQTTTPRKRSTTLLYIRKEETLISMSFMFRKGSTAQLQRNNKKKNKQKRPLYCASDVFPCSFHFSETFSTEKKTQLWSTLKFYIKFFF